MDDIRGHNQLPVHGRHPGVHVLDLLQTGPGTGTQHQRGRQRISIDMVFIRCARVCPVR